MATLNGKQQIKPKKKEQNNVINLSSEWQKRLMLKENGAVENTIKNYYLILKNDPLYANKIRENQLSQRIEYDGLESNIKSVEQVNMDAIQMSIEERYHIYKQDKFFSALRQVARENAFHPVKNYLEHLVWDRSKKT